MRRLTSLALAGLLLLGACGGGGGKTTSQAARDQLFSALDKLTSADSVSATLTIDSDVSSLQSLGDGEQMPTDVATKILNSSLTISALKADDPTKSQARIVLNIDGHDDLELRVVDQVIYVHVDAQSLATTLGQDPAELSSVAQQAQAAGLDFVGPALEGKWLALQGLDKLPGQLGSPAPLDQQKAIQSLANSLKASASVTNEGTDSTGDHLVASVGLRSAYSAFLDAVKQTAAGALPTSSLPAVSTVPDKSLKVDAWVSNGNLVQVEFNFLQIFGLTGQTPPPNGTKLALKLALEPFSGTIAAPEGAVQVDLQQLVQLFLGGVALRGAASGSASSSGSATVKAPKSFCKNLSSQPKSIQKQFAKYCP